ANTGFSGGGGLNRGDSRPSGGWSSNVGSGAARPSMDRPNAGNRDFSRANTGNRDFSNRPNAGTRDLSRDVNRNFDRNVNVNRDLNRNVNRNIDRNVNVNRNWDRRVNINSVNVRPGWARPGWGVARPWNYGWYGGWSTPTWGWWGARAAAWGVGTLATAAIINNAVDNAVNNNATYIVVPNSNYQLVFGSVQPSGTSTISFAVTDSGSTYELTADCQSGLLNGQEPQSAAEAELLNAACQVAFGNV
ncbi:MAG: hypothetical protein WBM08_15130, partial [Prochlorococcaceae cyanobacterium]